MLEIDHVTKRFGGLVAVDDVVFRIAEREIVGIFGPNGSGKTTLMNVIAGVFPATRGEVRWKGRALGGLRTDEVAACGVVKTFQNPQLFRELTVAENVRVAGHLLLKSELGAARVRTILPSAFRTAAARKIDARVAAVLEMTQLEAQSRELAGSLSYGGEKMLGVAMALMCAPSMLLLDEPGSGLSHRPPGRLPRCAGGSGDRAVPRLQNRRGDPIAGTVATSGHRSLPGRRSCCLS